MVSKLFQFGVKKVSESVLKIFCIGFGIGNNLVSKKVSDSVSEIFGIEKSLGFGIEKNYQKNLGFVCLKHGFVKFGIGIGIGFKTFPIFLIVSDLVSKISIGFGIGKKIVSKKVLNFVSEIFGIEKSIGFGIGKYLV